MGEELLRLENLSKFYTGNGSVVVGLDKLDLTFHRGEFVAITGESGSGKSTLSHVLGGILPYESGELYCGGKPTSHYDSVDWEHHRRDRVSFISQSYGILAGATVLTNVVSALRITGMEKEEALSAAEDILRQVSLWELRSRRAAKLSSGQKQRLSIARALAKPAPILIADEPTGNLDPENSRMVLELLAQAAKERLVLLVTHEFPEAEPYVTRHVVLQDGRVIQDAQLRTPEPPKALPQRQTRPNRNLAGFVARLQQRSRPVWTALVVLFFALTAFGVFAFLGTFIVDLDDTDTRIYDQSAFRNGNQKRIVVSTVDGSPMTEEDYRKLVAIPHVTALEPNGYAADVRYAYREGKDYQYKYTNLRYDFWGNPVGDGHEWDVDGDGRNVHITLTANAPFLKTVPWLPEGETFLAAGRLPENVFEAVAVARPDQIGNYAVVHLHDPNWGSGQVMTLTVEIVGVTDRGSGLYFHSDVGRLCQQSARFNIKQNIYLYLPNESLDDETFLTNAALLDHLRLSGMYQQSPDDPITVSFRNLNKEDPEAEGASLPLKLPQAPEGALESEEKAMQVNRQLCTYAMEVSPKNFDLLTWQAPSEQVSLTIADYAYTDRVVKAAQDMGYMAVSVYRLGATKQIPEKVQQRSQTLKICALALLVVVALQVVLLRAMYASQLGDYKLLGNMGLTCRLAVGSVWRQLVGQVLLGQLLAAAGIFLCARLRVDRILNVLRYLPISYVALLLLIHIAVSLVGALWVLQALRSQVYPLAGRESDLEQDKEAEV